MIAAALALILMSWDGLLTPAEGLMLVASAIIYTIALVRLSQQESAAMRREFAERST